MLIHKLDKHKIDLAVNTVRMLAADAIEKAQSGHPGLPMGFADIAFVLWMQFLHFNPKDRNGPIGTGLSFLQVTAPCCYMHYSISSDMICH